MHSSFVICAAMEIRRVGVLEGSLIPFNTSYSLSALEVWYGAFFFFFLLEVILLRLS